MIAPRQPNKPRPLDAEAPPPSPDGGENFGSGEWEPDVNNTLLALASCGKHYHRFDVADVRAGNVPCPKGCASVAWNSSKK